MEIEKVTHLAVSEPREINGELGPEHMIDVRFVYDDLYDVRAKFGVVLDRGSSITRSIRITARRPWHALLIGEELPKFAGLARSAAAEELFRREPEEMADVANALVTYARTSQKRRDDRFYLPFAVEVDRVMRMDPSQFETTAVDGRVFRPSGPYGRLAGTPYSYFTRRKVKVWTKQCRQRRLLTEDLKLTTKAERLRVELGSDPT